MVESNHQIERTIYGRRFSGRIRLQGVQGSTPGEIPDGWDAWCQFGMRKEKTFNVELMFRNMTPAEVVEWFDNMFEKLGCDHYELNDE